MAMLTVHGECAASAPMRVAGTVRAQTFISDFCFQQQTGTSEVTERAGRCGLSAEAGAVPHVRTNA